jgi:lactoylglutathione lyase
MSPASTPNVTQAVPFFQVRDMATSLRFYVEGLGFTIKMRWTPDHPDRIRWCWLELGGAAVMLQERTADAAARSEREREMRFSVCLMCRDALTIYRDALAKGLNPKRPVVGNALWVVSFTDPDGFQVDFESPTDVPEDTEYDPAVH